MYKDILKNLDQGYTTYEIGQTDGYKPCECEKCAKLFGVDDPGEKLWILQRKLAERLLKDRPGKKVAIISYGPTAEPPKTFHEFPPNVMIELANYSEESFEKWKKYKVPGGFTTYIYNWGGYQQAGVTPKSTPFSVSKQVDSFIANGVKGIYKCGWGELFGLEGPVYYVYGRMFDNNGGDYRRIADEFYRAAYGKAYIPMKTFFDTLYGRLELYANYLGTHCEAQKFAPNNPKPILAYNYSPEILDAMEKNLRRAEKIVDTPEGKLRVALVRKEFDYVKNLASIIHYYNAYKIAPDKVMFDKLAALIETRNKMIDSYYDEKGRMRKTTGWNTVRFLGGFDKNMIKLNGRSHAIISSPLSWDVKNLKKRGVLPGTLKKKYRIYRTSGPVPINGDLEKGVWSKISFQSIDGIQMGKTMESTKFKMTYDDKNLYIGFSSTLPPDKIKYSPVGHDGPAWQQESMELLLGPGGTDEYFHFIFNPVPESYYDAVNSMLIDPLDPLFGKDDARWNGKWEYKNHFDRENNQWNAIAVIPFKSLGITTPQPGSAWRMNLAREHFYAAKTHKNKLELYLWSPNLETMSFSDRDVFGELIFEGPVK